jgi:hypothetical protein
MQMQNGRKVSLFQMPPTDACQIIVLLKEINKNSNGTRWNMIVVIFFKCESYFSDTSVFMQSYEQGICGSTFHCREFASKGHRQIRLLDQLPPLLLLYSFVTAYWISY